MKRYILIWLSILIAVAGSSGCKQTNGGENSGNNVPSGGVNSPGLVDAGSLDQSASWPSKYKFQRGFLHSTAPFSSQIFDALRPTSWRLADLGAINDIKGRNIVVTEVMSDLYMKKTGSSKFEPWSNWDLFESIYRDIVKNSIDLGFTVGYWEIANEVDALIPAGTDEAGKNEAINRFKELNRRAVRAIRSVQPNAKIIGFSFSSFHQGFAEMYLDFLKSENLKVDAFAWHMLNLQPKEIEAQINLVRSLMSQRQLSLEIHINEFMGGQNHLIPGWNLAYLASLFGSQIESYSRACWQRPGWPTRTSECVSGLNGVLTADNQNLTKVGALYAGLNAMSGERMKTLPLGEGWAGLMSFDPNLKKGSMLVGTYSCGGNGLWCKFSDQQASDAQVSFSAKTISVNSTLFAGQRVKVQTKVLENNALDAVAAYAYEKIDFVNADSAGAFSFALNLKDGEVAIIQFSVE